MPVLTEFWCQDVYHCLSTFGLLKVDQWTKNIKALLACSQDIKPFTTSSKSNMHTNRIYFWIGSHLKIWHLPLQCTKIWTPAAVRSMRKPTGAAALARKGVPLPSARLVEKSPNPMEVYSWEKRWTTVNAVFFSRVWMFWCYNWSHQQHTIDYWFMLQSQFISIPCLITMSNLCIYVGVVCYWVKSPFPYV